MSGAYSPFGVPVGAELAREVAEAGTQAEALAVTEGAFRRMLACEDWAPREVLTAALAAAALVVDAAEEEASFTGGREAPGRAVRVLRGDGVRLSLLLRAASAVAQGKFTLAAPEARMMDGERGFAGALALALSGAVRTRMGEFRRDG